MVDVASMLEKVRQKKPLVHHITNWVTIYDCAFITRTWGALPIMAHAIEETAAMQQISNALVLNIGTLTPQLVEAMIGAGKKANELKHPIILDVVGAGATKLRTDSAKKIIDSIQVDIIKGNKSEIATIAGVKAQTRGVEAVEVKADLLQLAKRLARERNNTVVITGKEDIVAGKENFVVKNGDSFMSNIMGLGCLAASTIACFSAVEKDYSKAAAAALSCFGIAGERATKKAKGTGTFMPHFYDEIFNLSSDTIKKMKKIEAVE